MPKQKRTTLHSKHQMKLHDVRGVAMEQGRLYRLWCNGKLKSNELTRGVFALREIRCSLEAVPVEPVEKPGTVLNVVSVPAGFYVREVHDVSGPLVIEHMPVVEADSVSETTSEIFNCAQGKPADLTELEARLATMPRADLLRLAGVSDADN